MSLQASLKTSITTRISASKRETSIGRMRRPEPVTGPASAVRRFNRIIRSGERQPIGEGIDRLGEPGPLEQCSKPWPGDSSASPESGKALDQKATFLVDREAEGSLEGDRAACSAPFGGGVDQGASGLRSSRQQKKPNCPTIRPRRSSMRRSIWADMRPTTSLVAAPREEELGLSGLKNGLPPVLMRMLSIRSSGAIQAGSSAWTACGSATQARRSLRPSKRADDDRRSARRAAQDRLPRDDYER